MESIIICLTILSKTVLGISCENGNHILSKPLNVGGHYVYNNHLWLARYFSTMDCGWTDLGECDSATKAPCAKTSFDLHHTYTHPTIVEYKGANWHNHYMTEGVYPDQDDSGNWDVIECCSGAYVPPTQTVAPGTTTPATTASTTPATTASTTPATTASTTPATTASTAPATTASTAPATTASTAPATTASTAPATTASTAPAETARPQLGAPSSTALHGGPPSLDPYADYQESRPEGLKGSNGECIWSAWTENSYPVGSIVSFEGGVYILDTWASATTDPTNSSWRKVETCTGEIPPAKIALSDMVSQLDPNGSQWQQFLDPWTPLMPTAGELRDAENRVKVDPKYARIILDSKLLPLDEIEAIIPGRAANPENTKRIERIFPEIKFDEIFPVRAIQYTYTNFLRSVGAFPAYCQTYSDGRDSDTICLRLLASSFAHYGQEVGANTPTFPYGQGIHDAAHRNIGADRIYKVGDLIPMWKQALWELLEKGYTETDFISVYRQCDIEAYNMIWGLNYQCPANVDYFGRGSKQLSWNYNYGFLSRMLYGNPEVLLQNPSIVANSWLNFASGIWFAVTPQAPKPSMLHVLDGTWKPNEVDKLSGVKAGFGATIDIINGAIECRNSGNRAVANRIAFYKELEKFFNLVPETQDTLDCQGTKGFVQGSAGSVDIYWARSWSSQKPDCAIVTYQTPWQVTSSGDNVRCVNWFFRGHWVSKSTKQIVSDYGLDPGQSFSS